MQNGDSWDESRKFVLNELERLGGETKENTDKIEGLTTKLAVLWLKVSILGAGAGGVGVIAKLIYDLSKKG